MNSKQMIPIIVALVLLGGIGVFVLTRGRSTSEPSPSPTEAAMVEPSIDAMASPSPADAMAEKTATGSASPAASGAVKSLTVTGSSFKFAPATMSVNRGDTVRVTFTNGGGAPHDFVIDELNVQTKQLPIGQSETVTFVANKAGAFKYYCSVGNHRAQGMEGTLTVK